MIGHDATLSHFTDHQQFCKGLELGGIVRNLIPVRSGFSFNLLQTPDYGRLLFLDPRDKI